VEHGDRPVGVPRDRERGLRAVEHRCITVQRSGRAAVRSR
jgi:hypothetical protein